MEMPALLRAWQDLLENAESSVPLLHFGGVQKVVQLHLSDCDPLDSWFFIGDIHGDFFALHSLLNYAETHRKDCRIGFLGDMVDRGDCHLECVFLLLDWASRHPGRVLWIAGNHDLAFAFDESSGRFVSRVQPAEFLEVLNRADAFAGMRAELGRFFIDLAARLPRAVLFPDGLLMTHGGFPLRDLQDLCPDGGDDDAFDEWLNSDACLKDFAWTRIHRAPKKIPNRHASDPQFGHTDFESFCALRPGRFRVKRMVGGHVHPIDGYEIHRTYVQNPALTLVGFGFDDGMESPASYHHYRSCLYIGQALPAALPSVIPVPVDQLALRELYPMPDLPTAPAAVPDIEDQASCPPLT